MWQAERHKQAMQLLAQSRVNAIVQSTSGGAGPPRGDQATLDFGLICFLPVPAMQLQPLTVNRP